MYARLIYTDYLYRSADPLFSEKAVRREIQRSNVKKKINTRLVCLPVKVFVIFERGRRGCETSANTLLCASITSRMR